MGGENSTTTTGDYWKTTDNDFAERVQQRICRGVAEAEQVHIPSRAVRFIEPGGQQHRALEHEALTVRREAQPMQQAFQRVPGEQQFHGLAACMRQVQQALTHGRADVAGAIRHRW